MLNDYKRHVITKPIEMVELVKKGVVPWMIDVPAHLLPSIKDELNKYLPYKNEVQWNNAKKRNHDYAYLETYLYLTGKYGYSKDTDYDIYFNNYRIKKYPSFCFILAIQYSLKEEKQDWDVRYIYDYLEKGVKYKDPECLYTVGRMYIEGTVFEKNIKKGIKLLSLAGKYNHPEALCLLSNYYQNGILVKQDLKKSSKLMNKANEIGRGNDFFSKHPDIIPFWEFVATVDPQNVIFDSIINKAFKLKPNKIVKCSKLSDVVDFYYSHDVNVSIEIPKEHHERLFKELKEKVDEFRKNDYPVEYEKYLLAYIQFVFSEYGCKRDDNEIFKTIMDLEFIGSYKMYNPKGVCYEYGYGVEKNLLLAKECYLKAVETNQQTSALINLSRIHRTKKYEIYDEKASFEYACRALEKGINKALFELAYDYLYGIYVKEDTYKTIRLFEFGERLKMPQLLRALGLKFLYGDGAIYRSYRNAITNFKKAYELFNDIDSLYYLGKTYYYDKQYEKAFECFKKCESENYKKAYFDLALAYDLGLGVQIDSKKAMEYYNKVEENSNNGIVFNNLGLMYKKGEVCPKDPNKAFEYFKKAKDQKAKKGYVNLADCYFEGFGVEVDYIKGINILEEGIKENKSSAYIYYGYLHEKGLYGIKQDYKKAYELYSKGKELGDEEASYYLAWCHKNGIGCMKSEYVFFDLLKEAERKGYQYVNYAFGYAYYEGIGTQVDYRKAEMYLKKSIENKESHKAYCYFTLGSIYEKVYKKHNEAFKYYQKGSELEDQHSYCALGNCYYNGVGCIRDIALARTYWKKAAEKGNEAAILNLKNCK